MLNLDHVLGAWCALLAVAALIVAVTDWLDRRKR